MEIDDIFNEFRNKKEEITWPIEKLKEDIGPYLDKIVLYGAGSAGIAFLHYLRDAEIFPVFFSDGDTDKQGKNCEGLEIISPDEIVSKLGNDALVIVTINTDGNNYCRDFKAALLVGGHKGVHKRLHDAGCTNVIDYTFFRKCFDLFKSGRYNLPATSDVDLMEEHEGEVRQVYEWLEDEESKEVYLAILKFRMLDDSVDIPIVSEENMYFEYELFPQAEDEILVDCGACGGSSLKIFLRRNEGRFSKYYGIEPDVTNYSQLDEYIASLSDDIREKMVGVNAAAFNSDAETDFFVLNGPGTFAADIGPDKIKTVRIDSLLKGEKATYIKMNIEGSEVPALEGAEYTIKTFKPRLAIMGYHKTADLWEVPILFKTYRKDYKLYLRSYMKNVAFCYFAC